MSDARARIYARLIHRDMKSLEDIAENDRESVKEAYRQLYDADIEATP